MSEADAAVVNWNWRKPRRTAPAADPRALRLRGCVQGLIGLTLAVTVYLLWWPAFGIAIAVLAGVIGLSALLSPTGLYSLLQRLFVWTGHLLGRGLTWLMLVPLFYAFFYPFGVLFRRRRRDRMRRFYEPDASTYWEPHDRTVVTAGPTEKPY